MQFQCKNCGCINNFGIKQDKINLLLKKFNSEIEGLYCSIVDNHGFIQASEKDKSVSKLIEKKIILLYKQISSVKIIDFHHKTEITTLIEDFDVVLKGFLMFLKKIANDAALIAIIPPWLNMAEVLQEFEELQSKLSKYFIELNTHEKAEYILTKFL